jgi:hypothetical protein
VASPKVRQSWFGQAVDAELPGAIATQEAVILGRRTYD